jgi:hypothetical protein
MEGSGTEEHDAGTGAQYAAEEGVQRRGKAAVWDHRGIASLADTILVVNAGSSSIKFSVYEIGDARTLGLASKGQMDGIGTQPRLRTRDARGAALTDQKYSADDVPDVSAAMVCVGGWLRTNLAGASPGIMPDPSIETRAASLDLGRRTREPRAVSPTPSPPPPPAQQRPARWPCGPWPRPRHTSRSACTTPARASLKATWIESSSPSSPPRTRGSAMGLAISRTIVEAHGGRLLAANDPAGGATFRIHLRTDQPPTT